jgi:hypothetical protein
MGEWRRLLRPPFRVFPAVTCTYLITEISVMRITTQQIQKLTWLLLPLLAVVGLNVRADSHEAPPPPGALEGFFCTYNAGKDRSDLDSATSFYQKQAEKAGISRPPAYLWTHVKGTAPVDIVWVNAHESLVAYGAQADVEAASSDMAAVNERYDSVASCVPNLATVTPIIAPDPDADYADGATLATYACKFRAGSGPAALGDLTGHIADVNAGLGDAGLGSAFQIVPLTSDLQGPDVVFVARAESTAAWATNLAALNTTPAGQSLLRHFNAVVDCGMNLWTSEQLIGDDG